MSSSVFSDNTMLDAVASILARQHQLNKSADTESIDSPLLVLTNMPGKDSLFASVIMGSSDKNGPARSGHSEGLISNFEQVHALATANLLASTQRDIAKQLEEEEEANAELQKPKKKAKHATEGSDSGKANLLRKEKPEKRLTEKLPTEQKKKKSGPSVLPMGPNTCRQVAESLELGEPKAFVCSFDGCSRKFAWLNHLKYHELTHTNDRQFKCPDELCGKTFLTAQRLKVHFRTHTGERPFTCDHENCGKTFTTAGNLKNHQRIHTGEQPYACDVAGCSRRFTERSSLTKHKLTHSGDKPFECKLCGKKFTQSGSRRQHMIRHHLDDEIRKSLKQDLLASASGGQRIEEEGRRPSDSNEEAGGGIDGDVEEELCASSSSKVVKLSRADTRGGGGDDGGVGGPRGNAVSCSPQVLVLSNSYPGLPTSESVVLPHGLSDHIVTVTTQPMDPSLGESEKLSLSHTMLSSQDFAAEGLAGKSSSLMVLSEESTIYQHSKHHPADIVYSADILDREEIAQADYDHRRSLDYQGQMTGAGFSHEEITGEGYSQQEGSQRDYSHHQEDISGAGYSHQEMARAGYSHEEMTSGSYSHQKGTQTDYSHHHEEISGAGYSHEEMTEESYCQGHHEMSGADYSHEGKWSEADYSNHQGSKPEVFVHPELSHHPETFSVHDSDCCVEMTITEYSHPESQAYGLNSEAAKHPCGDEFIGAEEIAIAHHSDDSDYDITSASTTATIITSTTAGMGNNESDGMGRKEKSLPQLKGLKESSVQFSSDEIGTMDPMMECDEEPDKSTLS